MDFGEFVEDVVKCEVMEEMVIEIDLIGLIGVYSWVKDRMVVVVYSVFVRGILFLMEEVFEVCAFVLNDIPW